MKPLPTIESVLPKWEYAEAHHLDVPDLAPAQIGPHIDSALRAPDRWFDFAIGLRELPGRMAQRLSGRLADLPETRFGLHRFTPLGPADGNERLYGLVGRFWRLDYGLMDIGDLSTYLAVTGQPKLALDVRALPDGRGGSRLETRTRIHCPTPSLRRQFAPYWVLIRPVSGAIRRRMLGKIAATARASVSAGE